MGFLGMLDLGDCIALNPGAGKTAAAHIDCRIWGKIWTGREKVGWMGLMVCDYAMRRIRAGCRDCLDSVGTLWFSSFAREPDGLTASQAPLFCSVSTCDCRETVRPGLGEHYD